jgi:hypothetical protein
MGTGFGSVRGPTAWLKDTVSVFLACFYDSVQDHLASDSKPPGVFSGPPATAAKSSAPRLHQPKKTGSRK